MSNEYQPGDLVEATLGDTIIRGHITGCSGDYVGNSRRTVGALLDDNFTITVIEEAKPKVDLPTEPQSVVRINTEDDWDHYWLGWRAHNGSWDLMDYRGDGHKDVSDPVQYIREQGDTVASLVKLEPRAVTAKAVLDEVGKFAWADGFTAQIEATAKKFGVRSNA